jgi:two-component system, LytTR family, sensor kinase
MRKFLLHFLFWLVFFLMWNRVVNFYVSNPLNRIYFSLLDVSLVVSAFYTIYLYVMPDYIRRKRAGRLILLSIVLTVLLAGIYSWIMGVFLHHGLVPIRFDFSWTYRDMQYNRLYIALLGVLAGCFVKLAVDRLEVGRRMEMMEKEKSLAELTYLKAQINPHFLFNSLNSLYAQLEFNPEGARGTLLSLADMLRYQLYECNADAIPIAKELAYLENYFNLQQIRNDNCRADLSIEGNHQPLMIAPFLLMPFIENAFKYVADHDDGENLIHIKIDFVSGELQFYCMNTFDETVYRHDPTHKGIGLKNVKKRLQLIYGNNYTLKEWMDNGAYHVALTINLPSC